MAFGNPLAHIYDKRRGNPGWGQRQAWSLVGQTPSVSTYDADFGASDANNHRTIRDGFFRSFGKLPLSAPTITRTGTVSAQLNSLPAARFFQSYAGSGTGHNWSGGAVGQGQRMTNQNFNPNMQGAAELHPAMTYNPLPSPAALYPKVV